MKRIRRLREWLRPFVPYLNIGLAVAAYLANEYWVQGFCQPVAWAAWVLVLSTGAFLLWPWLKHIMGLNYLLIFLMGIHFTVCLYCVLFLDPVQLLLSLLFFFFLLPLLIWVPVVFGAQAWQRAWMADVTGAKAVFGLGALALLPVQYWAEQQYREIERAVATLSPQDRWRTEALAQVVPRTYMAERLAGAYFKYHNYPELIYDGWRPPLHDPLVNISLWSRPHRPWSADYDRGNPLSVGGGANGQAVLYHRLFPELPLKVSCVCPQNYDGKSYRDWRPPVKQKPAR